MLNSKQTVTQKWPPVAISQVYTVIASIGVVRDCHIASIVSEVIASPLPAIVHINKKIC